MWKGILWHTGWGFFGWIGAIGYHISSNYSMIMLPRKQKQIINLSKKNVHCEQLDWLRNTLI